MQLNMAIEKYKRIRKIPVSMKRGIYTLANDAVYDELVALLNSIEINVSTSIPVCIIPYDDNLKLVRAEIKKRTNVFLFEDYKSIEKWEKFSKEVWNAHPDAGRKKTWLSHGHTCRKFCIFDGPFDEFVFYDVDSLAMKPLNKIFSKLKKYDFIFDDWEHKKDKEIIMLNLDLLEKKGFNRVKVTENIHGFDFFGAKKGLLKNKGLKKLRNDLINNNEIAWINKIGLWDDVFLSNYMTLKSNCRIFNFTQSKKSRDRTGNCANADPFVEKNHILYNQEGMKPIHRIHFMGYGSGRFSRLAKGEDAGIPYQNVWLHYRFLKEQERMPKGLSKVGFIKKNLRQMLEICGRLRK
jgi:hypothetical protein